MNRFDDMRTWNMRYRALMEAVSDGASKEELYEAVNYLERLGDDKELSFGERKLLEIGRAKLFCPEPKSNVIPFRGAK